MNKSFIFFIIMALLVIGINMFYLYTPKCSIRDDPFSMHKVKVDIGQQYNNYQETLLCKRNGIFDWAWEKIAITPKINIRLYNKSGKNLEDTFPKFNGRVSLENEKNFIGNMIDGKFESSLLPPCSWTGKLGFCNYTIYIELDDKICVQYIGEVNYLQYYNLNIEECENLEEKI